MSKSGVFRRLDWLLLFSRFYCCFLGSLFFIFFGFSISKRGEELLGLNYFIFRLEGTCWHVERGFYFCFGLTSFSNLAFCWLLRLSRIHALRGLPRVLSWHTHHLWGAVGHSGHLLARIHVWCRPIGLGRCLNHILLLVVIVSEWGELVWW